MTTKLGEYHYELGQPIRRISGTIEEALQYVFGTLTDQAWNLDEQLDNNGVKQSIVQENLSPAFSAWKATIESELNSTLSLESSRLFSFSKSSHAIIIEKCWRKRYENDCN